MDILKTMDHVAASVLVIENHPLMREALCAAIAAEAGLKIAGQVLNGAEVLDMVITPQPGGSNLLAFKPDIILFSLGNIPQAEIETLKALRSSLPDAAILALANNEVDGQEQAVLAAGAHAVLSKTEPRAVLLGALQSLRTFKLDAQKVDFENNLNQFLSRPDTAAL